MVLYDDVNPPHVVGAGKTATNGSYLIKWTGAASRPSPAKITLSFQTALDDNVFFVADATGVVAKLQKTITPVSGTTQAAPQNLTDALAGADGYWNAYWAIEKQWRETLAPASGPAMGSAGTEVRGFEFSIPGFLELCGTSCAVGAARKVQLDPNAKFTPQARAMHEFGHIVSYQTHPWMWTTNYDWGGFAGWTESVAEWAVSGWEEANATHYGSITFWQATAVQPTTCYSNGGHCYMTAGPVVPTSGSDLEKSSYPFTVNNCDLTATNPEARWPISQMRFLWDVYDNHNDADGDSYSAAVSHYATHVNLLAFYPEGTDFGQIDEVWDASRSAASEPDGRGSSSYESNYLASTQQSVSILRIDNCSPP